MFFIIANEKKTEVNNLKIKKNKIGICLLFRHLVF